MTDREAILVLISALLRKDTEQDGNWGYPSFYKELRELMSTLNAASHAEGEKK